MSDEQIKNLLVSLLSSRRYFKVHLDLVKYLGPGPAFFLSYLINKLDYYSMRDETDDEWFYLTVKQVEKDLNLTKRQQGPIIKSLESTGLLISSIRKSKRDHKNLRHFKIDLLALKKILSGETVKNLVNTCSVPRT